MNESEIWKSENLNKGKQIHDLTKQLKMLEDKNHSLISKVNTNKCNCHSINKTKSSVPEFEIRRLTDELKVKSS